MKLGFPVGKESFGVAGAFVIPEITKGFFQEVSPLALKSSFNARLPFISKLALCDRSVYFCPLINIRFSHLHGDIPVYGLCP